MSDRPRVVLVDDHRMFRTGVQAELGETVDVVGEAEDVASAVRVILATRPAVVLLDVHLPGRLGRRRGRGPAPPTSRTPGSSPSPCRTRPRT